MIFIPFVGTLIIAVFSFIYACFVEKHNKQYSPYDELVRYLMKNCAN